MIERGDIVHYGTPGGACTIAIVTDVREETAPPFGREVRLTLFPADAQPIALPSWIKAADEIHVVRGYHSRAECNG